LRYAPAHAPKHHVPPISGGDRKALNKELAKSRAMTTILAERAAEKRRDREPLIREAAVASRESRRGQAMARRDDHECIGSAQSCPP
jgi:hypothetical protein